MSSTISWCQSGVSQYVAPEHVVLINWEIHAAGVPADGARVTAASS